MIVRRILSAPMALALMFWLTALTGAAAQAMDNEREDALDAQFARLTSALNRSSAAMAEQEIWRLWFIGPDAEVTVGLANAVELLRAGRYADSEKRLSALILKAPNYAELWNQRAFARFLDGDFDGSLKDIERTLALEPRHFGALSGRAQIEALTGRLDAARKTMGEVGRIHPWLARTSPIPADPPPPPPVIQRDL